MRVTLPKMEVLKGVGRRVEWEIGCEHDFGYWKNRSVSGNVELESYVGVRPELFKSLQQHLTFLAYLRLEAFQGRSEKLLEPNVDTLTSHGVEISVRVCCPQYMWLVMKGNEYDTALQRLHMFYIVTLRDCNIYAWRQMSWHDLL
jgi:hypothetical protein